MAVEPGEWTRLLAGARERLLSSGDLENVEGPRAEILRSWRRSYDEGASQAALATPYDENLNLSSRLVQAAEPVIGRVHEDVLGSPITVVLADSKGKVLIRRSGEPNLEGRLDRVLLAPGYNYAERYVGTNGIGTALEGRSAMLVRGAEHFNEELQVFACVGVPLRDPITRRQLGVLDITTWADRANPALTALVRQAASVIEEGLLELSSRGARALLDQYVVASRSREDHVLAISDEAFIGSSAAVLRLGGVGREELWQVVSEALSHADTVELPLLSATGEALRIRGHAVRTIRGRLVGAVLEFVDREPAAEQRRAGSRTAPAEDVGSLSRLSPVTVGPSVMVARMATTGTPVCLVGEPGVGKRTIVEEAARRHRPGRTVHVLDAETVGEEELVEGAAAGLADGRPVLVRAADCLPEAAVPRLLDLVGEPGDEAAGWLAFSFRSPSRSERAGEVQAGLAAAGVPMVAVPPLRARAQDLRQIVPDMLHRLSGGRVTGVSDELMARLLRQPWPGNLSEVEALLATMVADATGPRLDPSHLPEGFEVKVRHQLTPLEWLARDAIVEALRACGGDKAKAAESLGMSRASIYRKIRAYDIDVDRL